MKKKFDEMTIEDLKILRSEIILNSVFLSDYKNSFGFSQKSMGTFFDGYVSYLEVTADDDGYEWSTFKDLFDKYDTEDNLLEWYNCYDDYLWVEYDEEL